MAKAWTEVEKLVLRQELVKLYVEENQTLGYIANKLDLAESSVYCRLIKLKIPIQPSTKLRFRNRNFNITIPKHSVELAEFIGILLGDGHLTPTQVTVTLGTKEWAYVLYVQSLMHKLFGVNPKIITSKTNGAVVYLGSTVLVRWLIKMGLVHNKVKFQVDIPKWCLSKRVYAKAVVRGLIDTDGSIYRMGTRAQISFCNKSENLLKSLSKALVVLGFSPSKISVNKIYLTRNKDLSAYWKNIGFSNPKHSSRYIQFVGRW